MVKTLPQELKLTDLSICPQLKRGRQLVLAGNSAQPTEPVLVRELNTWIRFSPRQAATTDGLFDAASDNPTLPYSARRPVEAALA
jgi:hypothetical protein